MNTSTECERVRIALMASLDGESDQPSLSDAEHLSACSECRRWLMGLQSMTGRLDGLSYRSTPVDLWSAVEGRIHHAEERLLHPRRLWAIGAIVVAWRALQLFVDLPLPLLHPFVPLAATVAAAWLIARDPFAIETSAPELEKRGIYGIS